MEFVGFIAAFTTLFVMIDPIGLTPIFVALTQGMSARQRRGIALRAVAIATVLMTAFGLSGMLILSSVGITLPAFRIAGGLLLFLIAVEMLFEKRTQRREGQELTASEDPSVFPLATPLLAGPGALASMVLLATDGPGWTARLEALLAMASVMLIAFTLFSFAGTIEKLLGRTGIMVVTRLLGMLLAALSVQFVLDGLTDIGVLAL